MNLVSGTRLGPYEIVAPLGRGGMGIVFRALDRRLDRQVAIKVLPDHLASDPAAARRFEREARAVAGLNHPNILALYDVGREGELYFVVTELLEGETLRSRLQRGRLPAEAACAVGRQVASGLAAAHEKGVLHRDVKPENLWLLPDGRVKILDFGLAKRFAKAGAGSDAAELPTVGDDQSEWTVAGVIVGSVGYMSPEQLRARPLDGRSDLFSLGVVLREMVSGENPFRGESAADTASAVLHSDPPPLDAELGIPQLLEQVVVRCLRKPPEHRFQSARDLEFALASVPFGAGASAGIRAGSNARTSGRTIRRAALAGILGLLAVAAGWLWVRGRSDASSTSAASAERGRTTRAIAVLPIVNLSGEPDQEPFADGLTSTLITQLAGIADLRVVSYSSVALLKGAGKPVAEIAKDLDVDALIEGSVVRDGEQLRIDARLVDAGADRLLWARSFDAPVAELFRIQGELARDVAHQLEARLTADERRQLERQPTTSAPAMEAYLRGRALFEQFDGANTIAAREQFQRALDLDPRFADAAAAIAESYVFGPEYFGLTPEGAAEARRFAERALELDPANGSAHAALAQVRFVADWDWEAAEAGFRRAISLSPNSAHIRHLYSHFLLSWGRIPESLEHVRRMVSLDPASASSYNHLSYHYLRSGEYGEAVAAAEEALRIRPGYPGALLHLAYARILRQEYGDAAAVLAAMMKAQQIPEPTIEAMREAFERGGWSAYVEEETRQAEVLLAEDRAAGRRPDDTLLWGMAQNFAMLGLPDRAFEILEQTFAHHSSQMVELREDPFLASLRSDPRYADLERRVGFPPASAPGATVLP